MLYGDEALRHAFTAMAKRLAAMGGRGGFYAEDREIETLLMAICRINRMRWILQAICDLLGVLAGRRADWLEQIAQAHWYASYWSDHAQLAGLAAGAPEEVIAALGKRLGDDARYLLAALKELEDLNATEVSGMRRLERVWSQQFAAGARDDGRLMPFCSFCIRARDAQLQEGA